MLNCQAKSGSKNLTGCWETPICSVSLILALLDEELYFGEASEDISFQMAAKPIWIISNRASRCGVRPSTPQSSGFLEPCIGAFLISPGKITFFEIFLKKDFSPLWFHFSRSPRRSSQFLYRSTPQSFGYTASHSQGDLKIFLFL